jgi:hypothetical protein
MNEFDNFHNKLHELIIKINLLLFKDIDSYKLENITCNDINNIIVIPTFIRECKKCKKIYRFKYLQQFFNSLKKTNISYNTVIIIIDDYSDNDGLNEINKFKMDNISIIKLFKNKNFGNNHSFHNTFDLSLKIYNPSILITLDSDTIHKPNWLFVITNLYEFILKTNKDAVITGYNSKYHKTKKNFQNYCIKDRLGGVNLLFSVQTYKNILRNILLIKNEGWDMDFSNKCNSNKYPLISSKPSVIQHIGLFGEHVSNGSDVALDF